MTIRSVQTLQGAVALRRAFTFFAAVIALGAQPILAQTATKKTAAAPPAEPTGFSIESEMLTYRALESNGEAIACDIAGYLQGAPPNFDNIPAGTACGLKPGAGTPPGVLVTTFDQSAFDNLRLWREDMDTMSGLRVRAAALSCSGPAVLGTAQRGSAAAAVGSFTPVGAGLTLAQTALGLLSSDVATTPVAGTIHDVAFQDAVARQLRGLNVSVLMPFTYAPYTISRRGASVSPFLSSLDALMVARGCLDTPTATATAKALIADIDAFTAQIHSVPVTAKTASAQGVAASGATVSPATPAASSSSSQPHLLAVMAADELAQKLGVDPLTGLFPDASPYQHVLMLQALESGGSVEKHTDILGSKLRYSGGSVGTFALFTLSGDLECAGNVYEFGGSIPAKNFERDLRRIKPDPRHQYLFQRGFCKPLVTETK